MRFHQLALLVAISITAIGMGSDVAAPPPAAEGTVVGSVVFLAVPTDEGRETSLLLLVDDIDEDGGSDGISDRVFRLQLAESSASPPTTQPVEASVAWTKRTVDVESSGGKRILLSLDPVQDIQGMSDSWVGFGLSHTTGWSVDIRSPDLEATVLSLMSFCDFYECRAGGPGAETCSYGCGGESCSVGCSEGAHACLWL